MNADRRWMLLRAAVWVAIAVYAVFLIRDPGMGDAIGKAALEATGMVKPTWTPVPAPTGHAPRAVPPGDAADALLLASRLSTPECPLAGRALRLRLGPDGLASAEIMGTPPACAAERLWATAWPGMPTMELELLAG